MSLHALHTLFKCASCNGFIKDEGRSIFCKHCLHAPNTGILGLFNSSSIRVKHVCLHEGIDNYDLYHSGVINISRFSPALSHVYPLHLEIHFNLAFQCCSCFGRYVSNERRRECRKTRAGEDGQQRLRGWVCVCVWLPITSYLITTHTHH